MFELEEYAILDFHSQSFRLAIVLHPTLKVKEREYKQQKIKEKVKNYKV